MRHSRSARWVLTTVLPTLLGLAGLDQAAAALDGTTVHLVTASDWPRLAAQGIVVPAGQSVVLRVWDRADVTWSAKVEGGTVTLSAERKGGDAKPAWKTVATVPAPTEGSLRLSVAGLPGQVPTIEGRYTTGTSRSKREGEPVRVPPLAALVNAEDAELGPALDLVRGAIDRIEPAADPRRTSLRTNHEGAGFEAPGSLEAWHDRADRLREHLQVTLGLWPEWPRTPLNAQVYGKLERDGYTIEKVVLETMPGLYLAGNLYRPAKAEGPCPALLSPHGHYAVGRMDPDVQNRCIRWAKLGAVVFLYDMVGYNDSKPFGHEFLNPRLARWGLSLATLQTWNSIRALDWLTTLPDVDATRIGCTGESGGGTQTFLLAALDERVRVTAPVVMVSESFQGGCVCENAAGLRWGTDNVATAALAAPRPMILVGATGDWTARTLTHIAPALRRVYELFGVPDNLHAEVFDFPHNYNQTSRNAVYRFLGPRLLGVNDPEVLKEGEQTSEKAEDLLVFDANHPAPENTRTPAQLETELIAQLRKDLEALGAAGSASAWGASRALLATIHRVRLGVESFPATELFPYEVRRVAQDGFAAVHVELLRQSDGVRIPVVRLEPAHPAGGVVVLSGDRGKAGVLDAGGNLAPGVKTLLERGQTVVAFDPLLVGESVDPADFAPQRPETAHFATYNRTLPADRILDLATVVAYARRFSGESLVHLLGEGRGGVLALLARPALDGVGRTAVDLGGFDYGDGSGEVPPELDLPGVLQFGGLGGAAALAAPNPLWIRGAAAGFDGSWPIRAYEAAGVRPLLRIESDPVDAAAVAAWLANGRW